MCPTRRSTLLKLSILVLLSVSGATVARATGPSISSLSPTTGPVGISVMIAGSNFGSTQGGSTVKFSGTTASVLAWSNVSVQVTVPSGATTGNVVVNVGGLASNGVNFTVTPMPVGWTDTDIGSVGVAGSATYASGTITVKGAGAGITGTSDGFNLAYQSLSGDGTIVARVVSLTGGGVGYTYATAGVMVRETLTPGSTFAYSNYYATSTDFNFIYRATTGGSTQNSYVSGPAMPYWVKAVRSGSTFSGYISLDGVNWDQVGTSQTISMAQNVYVGLAVTNGNTSGVATATFDSVSVSSATVPAPTISTVSATTGPVGKQVTISGLGFGATQSSSVVTLNQSPVTINSWSGTSIVITIPTGATSGPLMVSVAPSMNNSNPVQFEITTQPLPTSWLDQDVGSIGVAGSATYASGTFTVKGAGAGISSTGDAFHFAYQPLSGDGTIVARVVSLQGGGVGYAYPTAGVMIRETLTPGSTFDYSNYYLVSTDFNFVYRTTTGGSAGSSYLTGPTLPYWVKAVRSASTFSSYISLDGVNWSQLGTSQTISMGQNVYVGLAVTNGNTTGVATATFDSVSVNSTTNPGPLITKVSATTGSIGSQVTISGLGFGATQGSSVVTLNQSPVTINSWSATSIVVTIPTGATSGPLMVSVAPNMDNSNPVGFAVTTQPLPTSFLNQDAGSVGLAGSATYANGTYTLKGAGNGLSATADGFQVVYLPFSGDGVIVARLTSLVGSTAQAGLMIRETMDPGARTVANLFAHQSTYFMMYERTSPEANITYQNGLYQTTLPYWMKLVRSGNTFSGYASSDGINWVQLATNQTVSMAQSVYVGLIVSSTTPTSLATATFDGVSINSDIVVSPAITGISATTGSVGSQVKLYGTAFGTAQGTSVVLLNGLAATINSWASTSITITIPTGATSGPLEVLLGPSMNSSNPIDFEVTSQPLPVGWLDQDIGSVGLAGSATYSTGTFTINGAGNGLYTTADGIHFVYMPLSGDGVIIARLTGLVGSTSQAGLMIRETMDPGSRTVANLFAHASTYFMMYERTSPGGSIAYQNGLYQPTLPYWMKLVRSGSTFSGYASSDGVNWVQLGTNQTVSMAQSVYVGFMVSSTSPTSLATATFDSQSLSLGTMPIISSITPSVGPTGSSVTVTGSNFGGTQGTSTISFNGVAATSVSSWTSTQIVAVVPSTASTGPVTVTVGSIQSNTNFAFTVIHPVLSGITPPAGQTGSTITLSGSGFGSSQGSSQVMFNGVAGNVVQWSNASITVTVPTGATTGPVTVVESGVSSNAIQFSVEPLSVTGISPNYGPVGTLVTITGTGFGSTQTNSTVDFYGTMATVQSWSDTQIVAYVPSGAPSGSVDVQVGSVLWYGPQFTITQTAHLTDSKSNQTTYTTALVGGTWVPSVGQGSGCSTCTQRGNISYTYDSHGNVLSRTDENGNATSYTYDSNGNVLTATVPISSGVHATTTYTYNSFGEVLTATDPLGFVTTNTYDANGNLLTVTTPAPGNGASASVTRFAYNSLGELTSITDALNNVTTMTYTAAGLIYTITDAQSNVTTYGYDSQGNRTSVKDALNNQTTFTYDAMNRLTKITYPDTTTTQFGYDIRGRRTTVTDQNSKTTTYTYDDADRMLTVTDAATPGNVTTYGYDTESNLTSIKDANLNSTTFDYDAFGRVTTTHFPSGKIETYGYDNVGNLTSKTDRKNQLISYTYDQLNRLAQKSYPDTTTVNYTYDNDSRLTQVVDPTGTYTFTFDNMGRLSGATTQYAFLTGRSFTTSYAYDAASNRTSFTDPESGSAAYVYDTLNRLQTLTPPTAYGTGSFGFGYDALSRRTSLTRPNSVGTSYTYDTLSRLLSVTHAKSGTTLDGASYTVDNAGNRLTRTPLPTGTASTFGYDNIYELLSVTQSGTTKESYTYDPVGNRLTALGSAAWSYNASNELTARPSSVTYGYDYNGNTLTAVNSSGTTTYAWDYENRLTSVTLPASGGTVSFKYDPFGRRIYKSSSSGTSVYAYDGDNLVEETNATGGVVARYSQGLNIDEPLAMLRSSATSYYQADGLGSVTSLTNTAGTAAQNYTYDSFGNIIATTGSLVNSFRYTGREWDTETSLYYYRARYYDPQTGRFISEDPTGFQAGVDFYSYAINRPVLLNDPTGLDNRTGRCKALSDAIKNLDKDIADAERDLVTNPNNLPESCPGDIDNPAASQSGHRRILRNLKTDRLVALVEYIIRNCGDIPPIPPIPVTAPNTNPAPGQTSTAVTIVITVLVLLGLATATAP